jgi:predicted DNA-binding transcriptional regulator YafY
MATNKNAIIRYLVLDKCFRNSGRKYSFDDLLEQVNKALYEDGGNEIQIRQLRDDIRFMKSDTGYSAPIVALNDGGNWYYKYEESDFSINNSPQRFDGAPGFELVAELSLKLNDKFDLQGSEKNVVLYDSNMDYTGLKYITPIFNAIVNKRVLNITYEPFNKPKFSLDFHPYILKQYNNRWFVFGRNELLNINLWNMPLDRIIEVKEITNKYIEDETNWIDFFSDFIGVTKNEGELVEVKLLFTKEQASYIITKPIHESQKNKLLEDGSLEIRIWVIPNYELEMKILSFGDKVRVVAPITLKTRINIILKAAANQY